MKMDKIAPNRLGIGFLTVKRVISTVCHTVEDTVGAQGGKIHCFSTVSGGVSTV